MLEGEDFLDGNLSVGRLVKGSDDSAVCAFTEAMEDLVIVNYRIRFVVNDTLCQRLLTGSSPTWKGGRGFWALREDIMRTDLSCRTRKDRKR